MRSINYEYLLLKKRKKNPPKQTKKNKNQSKNSKTRKSEWLLILISQNSKLCKISAVGKY